MDRQKVEGDRVGPRPPGVVPPQMVGTDDGREATVIATCVGAGSRWKLCGNLARHLSL